jgi:2-dehydro-3-deoxyphosphogluconate aldolase / (4S)-4-hydroxy-2-oxoglutarate aldolase
MAQDSVFEQLARYGVVPVVGLEEAATALPLADALAGGGLPLVEITFRTAAAADAIRAITSQRPEIIVGAGTILTLESLEAAKAGGAAFGVAPGLNPQIVRHARQLDLPFIPGVATATEIEQALSLGCRLLKFFPAEALGGVTMLEALVAPFRHTGVRFMATGGVSMANLAAYLKLDFVAAAGGSWLAKADDLSRGKWDEVRQCCRETLALVTEARRR